MQETSGAATRTVGVGLIGTGFTGGIHAQAYRTAPWIFPDAGAQPDVRVVADARQVLGLASCELFGRPGAVDLLLPRLLLGEPLDRVLMARLEAGGLVESLPVHRP